MRRELKVGIECNLSIRSTLRIELPCWDHLYRVLEVLVWSGMAIGLARVPGWCTMGGAMGRCPGSATAMAAAATPLRGMAGSSSSMMSTYTAPGRVALPWGLSVTGLFASLLSTQGCEVVVTTARVALLTMSKALGMGIGVSTLIAAIVRGHSEGISMNRWGSGGSNRG